MRGAGGARAVFGKGGPAGGDESRGAAREKELVDLGFGMRGFVSPRGVWGREASRFFQS